MIEFSFKFHDSPVFSNYEHDSSKIKEMLLKTHPFLSNCPKLIQTICSTTQSKYSLDTIKSLVSKAFTGTDIRIKDNLTTLLQIHEKNPICRAAKVFLEQYHKEILELADNPEEVDAKFSFFEEQIELSPLLPFYK